MLIEYNGQSIDTMYHKELTDEEFEFYRSEYYKKPSFDLVKEQFRDINRGGTTNNLITEYYVRDLMDKTKIYQKKWCIEDILSCKELLGAFVDFVEKKPVFFGVDTPVIDRIKQAFRVGGGKFVGKPANFPIGSVDLILRKYNVNNNWYDFSCGWGARLTGALKNKVNYFGTDPNYMLVPQLKQLAKDYLDTISHTDTVDLFGQTECDTTVDIRCQGSEEFVEEWENKIGLAFSSPPYFHLEDYQIGKQSYTEGTSYEKWKSDYLLPTMKNIYRYLVPNGYFILNIKNFAEFHLVEDSIALAESVGFHYYEDTVLKNIKRCNKNGLNDNNERMMVFTKDKRD